ncbi:MAG: hypothetical protein LUC91_10195 [Prevotella sp.]|nr:hypothetical protein [Prevotella sp.]
MTIYIIFILLLVLAAVVVGIYKKHTQDNASNVRQGRENSCDTCNVATDKCLQECLLEASAKEIEYFDDEELDNFKGRKSDSYTDEEVEKFADVLYTMKQEEVKEWAVSLSLRGINIPDRLKDEVIMLMENQ